MKRMFFCGGSGGRGGGGCPGGSGGEAGGSGFIGGAGEGSMGDGGGGLMKLHDLVMTVTLTVLGGQKSSHAWTMRHQPVSQYE